MSDEEMKAHEEKEAVASMIKAQSNMLKALSRIQKLESALKKAADNLHRASSYLPADAFCCNSTTRLSEKVKKQAEDAMSAL